MKRISFLVVLTPFLISCNSEKPQNVAKATVNLVQNNTTTTTTNALQKTVSAPAKLVKKIETKPVVQQARRTIRRHIHRHTESVVIVQRPQPVIVPVVPIRPNVHGHLPMVQAPRNQHGHIAVAPRAPAPQVYAQRDVPPLAGIQGGPQHGHMERAPSLDPEENVHGHPEVDFE